MAERRWRRPKGYVAGKIFLRGRYFYEAATSARPLLLRGRYFCEAATSRPCGAANRHRRAQRFCVSLQLIRAREIRGPESTGRARSAPSPGARSSSLREALPEKAACDQSDAGRPDPRLDPEGEPEAAEEAQGGDPAGVQAGFGGEAQG